MNLFDNKYLRIIAVDDICITYIIMKNYVEM